MQAHLSTACPASHPKAELVGTLAFSYYSEPCRPQKNLLPHPCLWQGHRGGVEEGVPESPRTLTPLDQHEGRNGTLLSESASVASAELVIFKLGP